MTPYTNSSSKIVKSHGTAGCMQLSFLSVVLKVALPSPFKSWGLIKKEGYDSLIKVTLLCILEFVKECQLGLSYIS